MDPRISAGSGYVWWTQMLHLYYFITHPDSPAMRDRHPSLGKREAGVRTYIFD